MKKQKLLIAYIPDAEDEYKFLCRENDNEIVVIYDYRKDREPSFKGCTVTNHIYVIKEATSDDLDEAFINEL